MNVVFIVFAGIGSRIHSDIPKQFIKINNKELVSYTISAFNNHNHIDEIILITHKDYYEYTKNMVDLYHFNKVKKIIVGGATRQESVRIGLESTNYGDLDKILIHDGDRPLVSPSIIDNALNSLDNHICSSPFIYKSEELDGVSNAGRKYIYSKLDIDIQTPQAFRYKSIKDLHIKFKDNEVSDDISLYDDKDVYLYKGEPINIKITLDCDLEFLKNRLK